MRGVESHGVYVVAQYTGAFNGVHLIRGLIRLYEPPAIRYTYGSGAGYFHPRHAGVGFLTPSPLSPRGERGSRTALDGRYFREEVRLARELAATRIELRQRVLGRGQGVALLLH